MTDPQRTTILPGEPRPARHVCTYPKGWLFAYEVRRVGRFFYRSCTGPGSCGSQETRREDYIPAEELSC
jgi:hypothetical protein